MEHKLISDKCYELLEYRINQEEFSSRLYEAMSLYLNNEGYKNAAKLWKKYSEEELVHAQWAKDYLLNLGMCPCLKTIEEPDNEFGGLPDIIRKSYDHEVEITRQCNELANCAMAESDMMLFPLALKYSGEQAEELGKLQDLLDKLKTFGEDKLALALLEHDLENYL